MRDITAIILTKNEEKNITDCINSIKQLVSRIVVVDSGSTDETVKISSKLGAEIYTHDFYNYSTQFNWALENTSITTEWALRIDADERFTPDLCAEIDRNIDNEKVNGYILRLRVYFMGRWIKHGGIYPFRKLLLFRHKYGYIEHKEMDEQTLLTEGYAIELKNDIIHYDFKGLSPWVKKHEWYAGREMKDFFMIDSISNDNLANKHINNRRKMKNRLYYKFPLFFRAKLYYIYRYYLRFGFLDGKEGQIYHFLQAYWYRFLVDSMIYEKTQLEKKE